MKTLLKEEHLKAEPSQSGGKSAGLCSACINEAGCTYGNTEERQVIQCEQFELSMPSRQKITENEIWRVVKSMVKPSERAETDTHVWGLCKNCGDFPNCTYPRSEGGVWHCEDYK
ncbi:MAG: hypothetical protein V2A78_03925 [bacterium]